MSDFDTFRSQLAETGDAADRARSEARGARLRASASADEQTKARAAAAQERAVAAGRAYQDVLARFDGFTDPRRNVDRLPDHSPILLLPLRLETRFGTTVEAQTGQERRELWVRIYPDVCSINSFDSELSTAEVVAGIRFWQQFWRAGGVDADRRAAWRNLAGAYGVGRAGWIVRAFAPVDPSAEPTRPDDALILVVSATMLPAAALQTQLGTFWMALWVAGDDAGRRTTAWNAFVADVGSAAAAQQAIEQFRPFNIDDPVPGALTRTTTVVSVAWLQLPDVAGEERLGWRQAPTARALPERFVVIGYAGGGVAFETVTEPVTTPLYLGPDPAAPPDQQVVPTPDGDLQVPDQLAWMFDFDAAVTAGMGVRIPLTADQAAAGFDRIVVVGLRMQAGADQGRQEVEQLIAGHTYSRSGFEILHQGVPTNNADGEPSAWSRRDDPDLAYDDVFGPEKFDVRTDSLEKRDGQVFAESLGLDPTALQHARGAEGRDSIETRALNTALAPGTLNYLTRTMMQPVFDGWVDELSWYFTGYVSGRGPVPAVRIGNQPYGVIASTAFSRMAWLRPGEVILRVPHLAFLQRLDAMLRALDPYWRGRLGGVPHVGDGGDPHQTLLGAVGLHPNSAEFHIRLGKSMDELVSRGALMLINVFAIIIASQQRADAAAFLQSFGYEGEDPDLLNLFFRSNQSNLNGPLIEDLPLSEFVPLAVGTTDGRNYLDWLADTAQVSLDAVRRQEGFVDDAPPRSLLYLMAQFALSRGYYDAGYRLRASSGLFTNEVLQSVRREPTSVHVVQETQISDSPWKHLYDNDIRLTGSADLTVAEHLTAVLLTRPDYAVDLADQIHALEQLTGTPTARLERILVEHIDTLAYRYDAWRLGTVTWQLERMRQAGQEGDDGAGGERGLYVGAYGWLENVRPKPRTVPAPQLPPDIATSFTDGPPLMVDPTNQGHLHAPSLNQAVTAAILRAGELSTRSAASPGPFSVNLSSERARTATALLDGLRTGQNIGALLGYRFERALHDASGTFVELDSLVFGFRRAFPLTADKLASTQDPPPPATEAIEARNVVDGLALVKRTATSPSYPYGADLPSLSGVALTTVEKAVTDLAGIFDALADLVVAEGVHQTAQSNPDRAAAHIDIQGDFTAPPEPAVIQTPTRGLPLTCRVGIELDPTATAAASAPPRVIAQPALNAWLADSAPAMADIACRVTWSPGDPPAPGLVVTLADLVLSPLDALELVSDDNGSALQELQDRIRLFVDTTHSPRPDARVTIDYQAAPAGKLSIFVASALFRRLRGLTLRSRPLRAGDVTPPSSGSANDAVAHVVDGARLADVSTRLADVLSDIDAAIAAAKPLLDDPVTNRATMLSGIDAQLAAVADLLVGTAAFGGARIGWHALYEWRDERFTTLVRLVSDLLDRWQERLAACDAALAAEQDPSATVQQRLGLLRAAEGQVSTTLAPEVDDPVLLRPTIVAKRTAFVTKRDAIQASAVAALQPGLADRLSRCEAVLPISDFDVQPLSFTDVADSIVAYWTDLQAILTSAQGDVKDRHDKAVAALAAHDASVEAEVRLSALQSGAEAVFGEGFTLIPTFSLPATSAAEQTQAFTHFTSGGLLAHAATALGVDNPLDTWLYGVARVRPKLRLVEDTVMLWEAHSLGASSLVAVQLPHKAGAPWLALDFDQADTPDSERMTYVALVPAGFDPAAARCGFLVDDWAETIPAVPVDEPGPQQTTGIAFHYDRPSQEPPQAMLLLTPAQWNGAWTWPDIVDGIIDTFDLARLRAVEPDQLDDGPLGQFLPATVAATTTSGLLLAANYVLANVQATIARSADA